MIIQFIFLNLMVQTLEADSVRERQVQACHFGLRKMNVTPSLASRACIQKSPLKLLEIANGLHSKGMSPDASAEEASRISGQSVLE